MNAPSVWKQKSQGTDLTFSLFLVMVYFLLEVELSKRFLLELVRWMGGFILGAVHSLGGGIMHTELYLFILQWWIWWFLLPIIREQRKQYPLFGKFKLVQRGSTKQTTTNKTVGEMWLPRLNTGAPRNGLQIEVPGFTLPPPLLINRARNEHYWMSMVESCWWELTSIDTSKALA